MAFSQKRFGGIALLIAMFLCGNPAGYGAEKAPRPNILFILVDDLGYGDIGVLYQNSRNFHVDRTRPAFRTPTLDSFAADGIQLRQHYCPAPVCAPSRASLLLGVHQGHANVRDNQFDKALENDHTLATVLRQAGYATSCIGKWGLQGPGLPSEQEGHPLRRGFDYFYGYIAHLAGHFHYPEQMKGKDNQGQPLSVFENETDIKAGLVKCYDTDLFTARAKKWMVDHRAKAPDQPFFMYLAYPSPHAHLEIPTQAYPEGGGIHGGMQWIGTPGKMINTASGIIDSWTHPDYASATWDDDGDLATPEVPWPPYAKRHATMVRRLDDALDDLNQTLKDLDIYENTLVVFASDNGPHNEPGTRGRFTYNPTFFDSFGPFDGIKRDSLEGGIRVPAIARWPERIPAGRIAEHPASFYDWLPTFAELAGVPAPARSDGVSLVPTLTGQGVQQRGVVYTEYFTPSATPAYAEFQPAHRNRERKQAQTLRIGPYQGIRYNITSHADPFEIYDVIHDPSESNNLAATMPELQQQMKDRVLQLRRPGGGIKRPYDNEPIPAVSPPASKPGLTYRAYEAAFPWVPAFGDMEPAASGTCEDVTLNIRTRDENIGLNWKGYLKVPADGPYTFYLSADTRAFLRLHDAALINADFAYVGGTEMVATANLKAGLHPISLSYVRGAEGRPSLSLEWSGDGFTRQAIPASAWVHADISPSPDN